MVCLHFPFSANVFIFPLQRFNFNHFNHFNHSILSYKSSAFLVYGLYTLSTMVVRRSARLRDRQSSEEVSSSHLDCPATSTVFVPSFPRPDDPMSSYIQILIAFATGSNSWASTSNSRKTRYRHGTRRGASRCYCGFTLCNRPQDSRPRSRRSYEVSPCKDAYYCRSAFPPSS